MKELIAIYKSTKSDWVTYMYSDGTYTGTGTSRRNKQGEWSIQGDYLYGRVDSDLPWTKTQLTATTFYGVVAQTRFHKELKEILNNE